jgi:Protein of unknown function (DUF1592)/Protein of unknown function (DUF1588)/Protein of unknown function (DUF1585)/Protein of unknown function (DUF1587)/Protein of unknown function (DUF1595)
MRLGTSHKVVGAVLVVSAGAAAVWAGLRWREPDPQALLDHYCTDCHNAGEYAGNLALDRKDVEHVGLDPATWERVVRKLRTGMMPPRGEPRPARPVLDTLAATLETRLDAAAAEHPNPGTRGLQRLNRSEYANAIRDLLDLDIDAATMLPLDDSSEGFDNIAAALGVSPSLIQAYVSAAMKLSRLAVGDRNMQRTQVTYTVPAKLAQNRHIEGLPLGTRGGIRFEHFFPLDAEYELGIRTRPFLPPSSRVDVTLDGRRLSFDNPRRFSVPVAAGPHVLTVAVVDELRPAGVDDIYSEYEVRGGISNIEIDGPVAATGPGDTPSRRRIFTCTPETPDAEPDCARDIVARLATRAFRRMLAPAETEPLLEFYARGRAQGDFEGGIETALARILVDPRFLYRFEPEPPGTSAGEAYVIDDFALASRLSFFLWSSIPDDALLEAAARGELAEPDTRAAQVRRMLTDPKSHALVENFAAQWLHLRELESITPDAEDFDENLRRSFMRETQMLVENVFLGDRSVIDLLDAQYTFADERLARHYEIPGVYGSHFRRIELAADSPRRGLLGHGSLLTVTSVTSRTSPVIRGSFVLENVLGMPAPVPPPNVETTLEGDDGGAVASSVRQRLEAHRKNPVCASCHQIMDPIGFALENFDLIGRWRETDGRAPIDASAELTDGTHIDGPVELREALLGRANTFVTTLTEKLMTYALGRAMEPEDMPSVRSIVRQAAAEDYRFSALVLGIVESPAFKSNMKSK